MPRFYYGWAVVAAAIFTFMIVIGATTSAYGLFIVPISTDLHLSRASMSTAFVALSIGGAIWSPLLGRIIDRVSVRLIMLCSSILLGASFVALGLSRSLWLDLIIVAVPLAAAIPGIGTLSMFTLIARWFKTRRGRAVALAATGLSLGNVTVAPLVGALIERYGWRGALVVTGLCVGPLLALISLVLRQTPSATQIPQYEIEMAEEDVTESGPVQTPLKVGVLMRSLTFWGVMLGGAIPTVIATTLIITLAPNGILNGLSAAQSTSLLPITGIAAITGKLLLATMADRIDRSLLLVALITGGALLNLAFDVSTGYYALLGCAAFLGFTTGALTPVFYLLLADRFGQATFGTSQGLSTTAIAVISMAVMRFSGSVFDMTGRYDLMFLVFTGMEALAIALIVGSRFGRSPEPAQGAVTTVEI